MTARTSSAAAVVAALCALALVEALAWGRAGVFEYPLDDVYIHLAMADGLLAGDYGVNPGELASAASSSLYPVVLAPFAGSQLFPIVPFAVNALALVLSSVLWARLAVASGATGAAGLVLVALGPMALNLHGIAFLGMEHGLHVAATLAALLGLVLVLRGERGGWLLAIGVIMGPLLRLEGLGVSFAVCLALLLAGRVRLALGLGVAALLPLGLFLGVLTALDIGPLPNSVMAKLADAEAADAAQGARALRSLARNLQEPAGLFLGVLAALLATQLLRHDRLVRSVAICGLVATLLHLGVGTVGGTGRYEAYALAVAFGATTFTFVTGAPGRVRVVLLLALVPLGLYATNFARHGVAAPRAIYLQQRQMARFASGWVAAPVAVNDIGRVAFGNPHYVLDLWGLASRPALEARLAGTDRQWPDRMAAEYGADLAMINMKTLGPYVGGDWVRLGTLQLHGAVGYNSAPEVAFFATRPGAVVPLRARLNDFAKTLPEGATFRFAPG